MWAATPPKISYTPGFDKEQTNIGFMQSGKFREKLKVSRKVRENQGNASVVWKNLCFPDKIRVFISVEYIAVLKI